MKDKTDQIIEAAIKVFVDKGFLQATTQEIAKKADVAEVTLYRKFSTKQHLFESVITKVIHDKFATKLLKLAEEEDTDSFFKSILRDRLTVISKNQKLVKILIAESIMGHLPNEINFTGLIFTSLKAALQKHFNRLNRQIDAEFLAKQIGSLLLGYALLPNSKPFHKLSTEESEELLNRIINCLRANS